MKNDPLTGTLIGVLVVSVLASMFFFYSYVSKMREMRQSQTQMAYINARRQAIQYLVGDVMEYSKTHPAIDPLLEQVNLKPKPGAVPATKPSSK